MDTIAAIATALAPSAVGIVRISGDATQKILQTVFTPQSGKPMEQTAPRTMLYGAVHAPDGHILDYVLCVWFAAEHSYTGELSAEIHCHGSPVVLNEVLSACFTAGARQALAGEFTKRAFLNGKMDLSSAEAVVDLIDAETTEAAANAAVQLGGAIRSLTDGIYDALLEMESRFYAVVDYPDEDIEEMERGEMQDLLDRAAEDLRALLDTFSRGKILRNGALTAIVGAPNAGKSSLLNRLVGFDRAIVTDIAGTTRDTVEEKAVVGGVLLRLTDTAGIREGGDAVEQLGIERSRRAVCGADLIIAVLDGSRAITKEDEQVLSLAEKSGKPWILAISKSDLPRVLRLDETAYHPQAFLRFSNETGDGISNLEDAVATIFPKGGGATLLTNARQADAVRRALDAVSAAAKALRGGMTPDVVLTEAESASAALGELTGKTAKDDIVTRIFERFCVGK